jgi:carbonic anhydrase
MQRILAFALMLGFFASQAFASDTTTAEGAEKERIRLIVKEVMREYAATLGDRQADPATKDMVRNLVQDNASFMKAHKPSHFQHFANVQHPRATVVTCADSRVHSHALDASPDGDLFMIRNIGNQITTAEGSVEYGVHHLHTPLLLIVGHSACGAIKAAAGDYSGESGPIRNELDTLQVPRGEPGMGSIQLNVHNQVRYAVGKFEAEVLTGRLTVIGAVYDFRNDLRQGYGKLKIINVNGETEPTRIAALDLMQGHDTPPPKTSRSRSAKH